MFSGGRHRGPTEGGETRGGVGEDLNGGGVVGEG